VGRHDSDLQIKLINVDYDPIITTFIWRCKLSANITPNVQRLYWTGVTSSKAFVGRRGYLIMSLSRNRTLPTLSLHYSTMNVIQLKHSLSVIVH